MNSCVASTSAHRRQARRPITALERCARAESIGFGAAKHLVVRHGSNSSVKTDASARASGAGSSQQQHSAVVCTSPRAGAAYL